MKKQPLLVGLLVLLFCNAFTTADWKPLTLQEGITVDMPGTITQEKVQEDLVVHKAQLDAHQSLSAMVVDYTRFGLTADLLQQMAGTDAFRQQLQAGIESSGATVVEARNGQYHEQPYCEFEVEREQEGKKIKSLVRIVFYRQWGINLTYKYSPGQKQDAVPTRFMNSLKIAK